MTRRSKGRQRIDIAKMQNESKLQVTFSKRRAGLFKKVSELCTLCGAEIAIVVFSPGRKVYSFGHPSVELLVDRFLGRNLPPPNNEGRHNHLLVNHQNAGLRDVPDGEKAHGESILDIRRANGGWWEAPINALNLSQLQQLMEAMKFLKQDVEKEAQQLQMVTNVGLPFLTFGSALSPTYGARACSTHGLNVGATFANRV
ncbi:Agamous-like MADS-box protein AGL62 [Capsicum annuum]|uniref:Agamous-like MADS-box protein AGL62 n=1 Tax=Capsicum annuum TaxID=4072 RepID=A0A2G2XU83_CAPAN|nr:Agamous-like MADS-box protein AGL62 [Capsicum annuum]